jgi:multidrug efflux system membrane fusion protein
MIHIAFTARIAAVIVLFFALASCGDNGPQAPPGPQVTVAKPVKREIVDMDEYVGRFIAVDTVEVRARVSGYLEQIDFKDGQIVQAGDLLFSIDKRPFQNTLDQAKGTLAQARANLAFTESDLARAQRLVTDKTISEQAFEQRTQAKRNAEASVSSNEAAVRQAELDLQFTELRAPVTGRIGDRRVAPGNLVTGGTTGTTTLLATIVSIDPMRFEFTADEGAFIRYERIAKNGNDPESRYTSTPVELKLLDEQDFVHKGKIDFVDNVIDQSSGTIRGRAVIPNPDGFFTPGMFARVRVPGSPKYEALLVPDAAIGSEQVRKFAFVVDGDNTVKQKYLTLGTLQGNLRVVKSGLEPDDRVIVNGLMRARPGAKVTPVEEGAPPPGAQPQGKPAAQDGTPPAKSN